MSCGWLHDLSLSGNAAATAPTSAIAQLDFLDAEARDVQVGGRGADHVRIARVRRRRRGCLRSARPPEAFSATLLNRVDGFLGVTDDFRQLMLYAFWIHSFSMHNDNPQRRAPAHTLVGLVVRCLCFIPSLHPRHCGISGGVL